ncbi:ECF RNA polymerase sigma factor SigR [Neolewinella maritima]|uniref:ECF RNA polymerase sigma factor SigR n=1 Tax=Neolewinella maritima TaxID=1383882 RepID=A0ABN8FDH3_9BACT|nr:sigma-70 family RNA polymerase sigma factor [Neolewinella maritima]CAH1002352.1 ECF RNA polymerase sigma factor SigR [Neolewinella maritima]
MTESDLIERFRRNPTPAQLLPVYERYAERIYGWCLRYLGTPERAEDAGAELFPVLLRKLPKHEVTNFGSWLQSVVRNHCLMQLRREQRDPLALTAAEDAGMQSANLQHLSQEPTPDTRPLHHCMKQLSEDQRRCIHLFYLREGHSYQSVAAELHLSVGQVRSHLQNGRRTLKLCLEAYAAPKTDPRAH